MSNRAYRVNQLILKKDEQGFMTESINLTHSDRDFIDFLDKKGFLGQLDEDLIGLAYVDVETIEEAIRNAKDLKLPEWTVKALQEDVIWATKHKENEVGYYCT